MPHVWPKGFTELLCQYLPCGTGACVITDTYTIGLGVSNQNAVLQYFKAPYNWRMIGYIKLWSSHKPVHVNQEIVPMFWLSQSDYSSVIFMWCCISLQSNVIQGQLSWFRGIQSEYNSTILHSNMQQAHDRLHKIVIKSCACTCQPRNCSNVTRLFPKWGLGVYQQQCLILFWGVVVIHDTPLYKYICTVNCKYFVRLIFVLKIFG